MKIGMKIKELRSEKTFTQEILAEKLQVSRSTISSWETGRSYPDLQMVVDICDLFEVSLDDLLREDTQMVKKLTFDYRLKKFLIGVVVVAVLFVGNFFLSSFTIEASGKGIVVEEVNVIRDGSYAGGDSERDWNTMIRSDVRSKNPFFMPLADDFLLQSDGEKLNGTVYGSFNFFNLFKQRKVRLHQSVLVEEKVLSDQLTVLLNGEKMNKKALFVSEINQKN
ncbi:helix-turn-helix domain-containing protein [Enterococcus sp. LJL98]